jgi:transposase
MDASTRFDTQIVGGVPVLVNFLERLKVADTIDRLVPWEGDVPLGTVIEVMIINRLLAPQPLYRIDAWAHQAGVTDFFGLRPGQLNDDLLGRALERIHKHVDPVQADLVVNAVRGWEVDVSEIHYDITSVELYGAYAPETAVDPAPAAAEALPAGGADGPPPPQPAYGRSKSGRKNLKQIQVGVNVTGDGGVPVAHVPLDGNTAEVTTHIANMRRLAKVLGRSDLLFMGDTKQDSVENLLHAKAGGGEFLCGGAFTTDLQAQFLRRRHQLRPVAYFPKSQAKLPAEQRDQYQALEVTERLRGEVAGRKVNCTYRTLFVWSEAKARQEATTRERHVGKIRQEFEAVERNLNRYTLKTRDAIVKRLELAKAKYGEGQLFTYELTEGRGAFTLRWRLDPKALQEWQALEGVYVLKTSLSRRRCPLAQALAKYKEQSTVERRIHYLKGPLAVAPMFLEKPERIAGLLCVLVWALLVLTLMERQVRRSLKGKPLYGLYPEHRPSPAPTGPAILKAYGNLCIVIIKEHGTTTRRLAQLSETQHLLLRHLGIPPDDLRAFKRRCRL